MNIEDIAMVPIELWDIGDIVPYPHNNKKHPDKHIEILSKSIAARGHLEPLILDGEGVVIGGHGRLLALKKLGRLKVAVRVLKGISPNEASALRIALNKTVSNEYDTDALTRELAILTAHDFDLSDLGFNDKELSMLVEDVGDIDIDLAVEDMTSAVEKHEREVTEKADEVSDEGVTLQKAFGFKSVSLRDQKHISRFMAEIEATTGKTGAEALVDHVKSYMVG